MHCVEFLGLGRVCPYVVRNLFFRVDRLAFFGCIQVDRWPWGYLRLPECKGRTYEELDIIFSRNLESWEVDKYHIDHQVDIESKMQEFEHRE